MYICYIYEIIYTSALYEWNAERANAPKLSYDYTQAIRGADITSLACGRYLRDEMSSRTSIRDGDKFEMLSEDRRTLEMPELIPICSILLSPKRIVDAGM